MRQMLNTLKVIGMRMHAETHTRTTQWKAVCCACRHANNIYQLLQLGAFRGAKAMALPVLVQDRTYILTKKAHILARTSVMIMFMIPIKAAAALLSATNIQR